MLVAVGELEMELNDKCVCAGHLEDYRPQVWGAGIAQA